MKIIASTVKKEINLANSNNSNKKKILPPLYQELVELLVKPDLILPEHLCFLVQRTDVYTQSKIWHKCFSQGGNVIDLLGRVISKEVRETQREGILFRGNNLVVILQSAHVNHVGITYITKILKPLIDQVRAEKRDFEIDPSKLDQENLQTCLQQNRQNLLSYLNMFVDAIFNSINEIPQDIRKISRFLKTETEAKFPKSATTAVGGLFFLRLVCPTIINPVALYGGSNNSDDQAFIQEDHDNTPANTTNTNSTATSVFELTREERRPLLLISKALQNLSNNLHFNEEYMQFLNKWLDSKQDKMNIFLASLSNLPQTKISAPTPPSPRGTPLSTEESVLSEEEGHLLFDVFEKNFSVLSPILQQVGYTHLEQLSNLILQITDAEEKAGKRGKRDKKKK